MKLITIGVVNILLMVIGGNGFATDVICTQNVVTNILMRNSNVGDSHKLNVVIVVNSVDNFTSDQLTFLNFMRMRLQYLRLVDVDYSVIYLNKFKEVDIRQREIEGLSQITNGKINVFHEFTKNETDQLKKYEDHHAVVLDRCGKITYQILPPWSFVQYPYIKAAILSTYFDDPCGNCSQQIKDNTQTVTNTTNTEAENNRFDEEYIRMTNMTATMVPKTPEPEASPIQLNILMSKEEIFNDNPKPGDGIENYSKKTIPKDSDVIYIVKLPDSANSTQSIEDSKVEGNVKATQIDDGGKDTEVDEIVTPSNGSTTTEPPQSVEGTPRIPENDEFLRHYSKLFQWINYKLP